jgi:WD40 repeat protein
MLRSRLCVCVLCAVTALILAMLLLLSPPSARAQEAAPKGPLSFINDVAPILKENCFACHDAKKRKGKLDMTTFENLRKGGEHENPIKEGKPDDSYLIDAVKGENVTRMPPKGESGVPNPPLPKEKIAVLEQWIKEGAKLDPVLTPKSDLWRETRIRWQPPPPPVAYKFPAVINALAFTPDNKSLVVGGQHELVVWNIAEAKLEKRIATRAERAHAMLFLPDGKLVVAGGRPGQEGDVRIFDINGGTPKTVDGVPMLDGINDKAVMLKALLDTDDSVLCLALSADGKKLASGGWDRLIHVWDLSPGYDKAKEEQSIENHADKVFGVAFTPDGKFLLSCGFDKTAKMWDLEKKESVLTFPDHQAGVNAVVAKADGKLGFSVGDDNQLRAFNLTGDAAGKQVRAAAAGGKGVFKLIQNPKQPILVTCSADQTVRLWNTENGAALKTLSGHTDWVYAIAVSPDGTMVASGSWNGDVKVWKIPDGTIVKEFNGSPGYKPPEAPKK